MKKLHFDVLIDAKPEQVWEVLWGDQSYRDWTSVFSEGSQVQTDWKKGSKVLFLDGKGSGMVSFIEETRAPEFLSFKHMGIVANGVESMDSKEAKEWAGAIESYSLKSKEGKTALEVDVDVSDDYISYMEKIWPQALDKVKHLSENKN